MCVCACLCGHKWRSELDARISSSVVSPDLMFWDRVSLAVTRTVETRLTVHGSLLFACLYPQQWLQTHISLLGFSCWASGLRDSCSWIRQFIHWAISFGPTLSLINLPMCSITLNISHTLPSRETLFVPGLPPVWLPPSSHWRSSGLLVWLSGYSQHV